MTRHVLMTADAVGGVWTYATELGGGLAAHGFETTIAVIGPAPAPEALQAAARITGVQVIETGLPLDWLADAAATRRTAAALATLATRLGVDLIHCNSPALAGIADWPAPVVGVAHGCLTAWWDAARPGVALPADMAWHRRLMEQGLAGCASVIAPSAAFGEQIRRLYNLPHLPRVVHNGRTWPAPQQASPPADFVLTAGRLWDEVKNTAVLDAAAGQLRARFEAAGPLVGPHGEAVQVRSLVALGNLAPAALARRMGERPVFVSAAQFEPFGLAVLEAAASGCALVLSDIPTFRELWDGAAEFAQVGDAAGFARRIDSLMGDSRQRLALGERARRRTARYSVARMAAAMAQEYRAVLGTPVQRDRHRRERAA